MAAQFTTKGPEGQDAQAERPSKVPAAELLKNNRNLDRKNPLAQEVVTCLPPEQLVESILEDEHRIAEIMAGIKQLLSKNEREA